MTASSSTDLQNPRFWHPFDLTCASLVSGFSSTRRRTSHALATGRNLLLMSSDVITPRQQPRKHVHVNPSPRQRHVIGWRHRLYCSTRDPTRKPETDPDQYPLTLTRTSWLWLWLFALTFDQKSKFSRGPILLNFSRRFQFWAPFLHLKFQNWSIGTFFIMVSSKALFMASSRDLLMFIQPQAFIELPLWVWGRVLEIYIRYISPM